MYIAEDIFTYAPCSVKLQGSNICSVSYEGKEFIFFFLLELNCEKLLLRLTQQKFHLRNLIQHIALRRYFSKLLDITNGKSDYERGIP